MQTMIQPDAAQRPSAAELLEHPLLMEQIVSSSVRVQLCQCSRVVNLVLIYFLCPPPPLLLIVLTCTLLPRTTP